MKMQNMNWGWQSDNTFVLTFDGGIDEDGDEYWYCCEYWSDDDSWHFDKMYKDDHVQADFTENKRKYIKIIMIDLMKRGANNE